MGVAWVGRRLRCEAVRLWGWCLTVCMDVDVDSF
jgi:hypothetical protein